MKQVEVKITVVTFYFKIKNQIENKKLVLL